MSKLQSRGDGASSEHERRMSRLAPFSVVQNYSYVIVIEYIDKSISDLVFLIAWC